MKTYRYLMVAGLWVALLAIPSCTGKFDDYNSDNTGFTNEQQEYDYNTIGIMLKVIQSGIYFNYDWGGGKNWTFQAMQNLNADMFAGYMHNFKPFNAGMGNTVYNLLDEWNGAMWENTYGYIMTEIKKSEDFTREDYPDFFAITRILKVEAMHRVSDYYGPIVYTKFGESSTGVMPDTQRDVYSFFFRNLEEAITLLKQHTGVESFARFDMMMPAGKKTYKQWIRFANSLRLRLAVRIAMADPQKAREEALKSLNPANGGLLETKDDLVAVSALGTGYLNPLGEINKSWGEAIMNANMESILTGYADPRLAKYFEPAVGVKSKGQYRGIRQGTGFNHTKYSTHSRSTIAQTTDAILMTPAEVWFLRAEAALRGWTNDAPAACYTKGVTISFEQWNLNEELADYLASERTAADFRDVFDPSYNVGAVCKVSPKWNDADTQEVKLEKIITQKWIAGYPEGCEAWAEQRRTGYPRLFPVLVNKSGGKIDTKTMIRRLNFPSSIITSNPSQYEALCRHLGGADTGGTRLWWDTGHNF